MKQRILICGPNWLGDGIMSMPALQMLREREPGLEIVMLAKRSQAALWALNAAVGQIVEYADGWTSMRAAVRAVRAAGVERAYVFPNSVRSALVPWMAAVKERTGARGHCRSWLLTRVVAEPERLARLHQAWEYVNILGLFASASDLPNPRLTIPAEAIARCRDQLGCVESAGGWVGMIPGAARGPSKRWPPAHFAETGLRLVTQAKCRVLVFGTQQEGDLCRLVAGGIGAGALNLAGTTTLPELAAFLSLCRVVVANDSGGLHLAAASGTRVVGVFGMTDPAKTGPLGTRHAVVGPEHARLSRDIARRSADAERVLRSIEPDRVTSAVLEILERREG
jgi:heptosyltransferase-2